MAKRYWVAFADVSDPRRQGLHRRERQSLSQIWRALLDAWRRVGSR
jgi:hypothetical protein